MDLTAWSTRMSRSTGLPALGWRSAFSKIQAWPPVSWPMRSRKRKGLLESGVPTAKTATRACAADPCTSS